MRAPIPLAQTQSMDSWRVGSGNKNLQEILETMRLHGGVLLDLDMSVKFSSSLDELYSFLAENHCKTTTCGDRSHMDSDYGRRFSLNRYGYYLRHQVPCWCDVVDGVLAQINYVVEALFAEPAALVRVGGDIVLDRTFGRQTIHGDGTSQRPKNNGKWSEFIDWSPWLVASIAVHDITVDQAPLLFVGRQTMMQHESPFPPALGSEPPEWHSRVQPMRRGQVFLRDPRVWHAGTPNSSDRVRILPAFSMVARSFS